MIEQRLAVLRPMDRASLLLLADSSDDVEIDGLPAKLNVYREQTDDGQTRIVVQGYRSSQTGISALVIPRGFLVGAYGYVRDLREDEMYEYT